MNGENSPPLLFILIEEYKIHKDDLYRHRAIYTSNTTYLQFLGIFIFTIYLYAFEHKDFVQGLPLEVRLLILSLGSLLIFFFFSSVIASIYMFFILRRRMAEIENRINKALGEPAMIYESQIAPVYFERPSPHHGFLNPLSYQSIFRILLFTAATLFLIFIAVIFLGEINTALVYIVVNFYIWIMLLFSYSKIYYLARDGFNSLDVSARSAISPFSEIVGSSINLLAIVLLVLLYYGDGLEYYRYSEQYISRWGIELYETIQYTHGYAIFLAIGTYTMLCAIIVPTPSEMPILLWETLPILPLLAASSFGRAIGAILLASGVFLFRPLLPYWLVKAADNAPSRRIYWRDGMGPTLYILFQSIPFLPMRTSTILFALASGPKARTLIWIALANLAGTPVRMLLMLVLITVGVAALDSVFSG